MPQRTQQESTGVHICRPCNKSFKTPEALDSHVAAKRHPYCKPCKRFFGGHAALDQHRQQSQVRAHKSIPTPAGLPADPTLGAAPTKVAKTPTAPPSTAPAGLIIHRGNAYTALSETETKTLQAALPTRCHTLQRLRLENYTIATDLDQFPTTASSSLTPAPPYNPLITKRKAIVLDCEMIGTSPSRFDDEVVSLSAIDFFTGETLVGTLVRPVRQVTDWRANITGITPTDMAVAVSRGEAVLGGSRGARGKLWEHMDERTIVIGHSVNFDLKALGITHTRIVDSAILTAEPVFGEEDKLGAYAGLEKLCRELVGLGIRASAPAGSKRHDSLEDVLATRELVIWCLRNPDKLKTWAEKNWAPKKKNKGKKRAWPQKKKAPLSADYWGHESDEYDDDGMLRWEDVVDWDTWPKSPPDWD